MGCKSRLGFNGTSPKVNKAWSIHNESNRQVLAQYDEWFEQESVTDNVTKGWMIPLKQKRDITNSIKILKLLNNTVLQMIIPRLTKPWYHIKNNIVDR